MAGFSIEFLDHVAIRVNDLTVSAEWYEQVLGLTPYRLPEWGDFPIFMLTGKSGVALFPKKKGDAHTEIHSEKRSVDHFAFQVTNANFAKARKKYESLNITYNFQDHHYFHSIYTKDPDGHVVELTTLAVDESSFYLDDAGK